MHTRTHTRLLTHTRRSNSDNSTNRGQETAKYILVALYANKRKHTNAPHSHGDSVIFVFADYDMDFKVNSKDERTVQPKHNKKEEDKGNNYFKVLEIFENGEVRQRSSVSAKARD